MPQRTSRSQTDRPQTGPRRMYFTETIGRAVKDDALAALQDQLVAHASDFGYVLRRRTVVPHIGHLSVQELVQLRRGSRSRTVRSMDAASLVSAMETAPLHQEISSGVHAAILKDRDLTGGLVLASAMKSSGRTSSTSVFRRLNLGLADEAEAEELRMEAVALRERILGRPLDEADVAALPAIAIPLGNLAWIGGAKHAGESLDRLHTAGWDIPAQITLGPLEAVTTDTIAAGRL